MLPRIPHLKWRTGPDGRVRPRWEPSPGLRALGLTGEDLKDAAGEWLGIGGATERAISLNAEAARLRLGGKRTRKPPASLQRTCRALADKWKADPEWRLKAPKTQQDYALKLDVFLEKFGDAPVRVIERHHLKEWWRQVHSERGHAMANGAMAVVRAMFSYAIDLPPDWMGGRGNPALRMKLPKLDGRISVWLPEEIEAAIAAADSMQLHSIGDAIVLALHSAQREADVLALPEHILEHELKLTQAKTSARIDAPMTEQLKRRMQEARLRKRSLGVWPKTEAAIIVQESTGRRYKGDSFRSNFARVRAEAAQACPSIADKWFSDLRDTAITRLALAGCTLFEICSISGHSAKSVEVIIKHYLGLGPAIARGAIGKLSAWLEQQGIAL